MEQESSDTPTKVETTPISPPTGNARTLLGRVNNGIYLYHNIRGLFGTYRTWQSERKTRNAYSVAIEASDRFYYDVQRWLVQQVEPEKQRTIRLVSLERYDEDTNKVTDKLFRVFDSDTNAQKVTVDGHEVTVTLEKPVSGQELLKAELVGVNIGGNRAKIDSPRLVFWTYSSAANEAVLSLLARLKEESKHITHKPRLHLLGTWYGSGSQELPARDLDSLVLEDGQMERIMSDLERFLNSERDYARRGIPWHRGYFFHGPPGTGKSSLAKVLATHFGLDLYYYPIGAANSDTEITNVISKVSPKSILLLEDIDVFKGFKKRTGDGSDSSSFSTSGLLNMLDGVMTPHGLITIMTSNHKEVVDPAIFRPGRVDLDEEIGALKGDQTDRLFKVFYGQEPNESFEVVGMAPAVVMEIMKRNMYEPDVAEKEIRALRDDPVNYEKPHLILPEFDVDEVLDDLCDDVSH